MFKININLLNFISCISSNFVQSRFFSKDSKDSKNPLGMDRFRNPNYPNETDAEVRARMDSYITSAGEAVDEVVNEIFAQWDREGVPKLDEPVIIEPNECFVTNKPSISVYKPKKKGTIFKATRVLFGGGEEAAELRNERNLRIFESAENINYELHSLNKIDEKLFLKDDELFNLTFKIISAYQVAVVRSFLIGKVLLEVETKYGKISSIEMIQICRFLYRYPKGLLGCALLRKVSRPRLVEGLIVAKFCKAISNLRNGKLESRGFILSTAHFNMVITIKHIMLLSEIEDLNVVNTLITLIKTKKLSSNQLDIEIERRKIKRKKNLYK